MVEFSILLLYMVLLVMLAVTAFTVSIIDEFIVVLVMLEYWIVDASITDVPIWLPLIVAFCAVEFQTWLCVTSDSDMVLLLTVEFSARDLLSRLSWTALVLMVLFSADPRVIVERVMVPFDTRVSLIVDMSVSLL